MGFKKSHGTQRDAIKLSISHSSGMCGIVGNHSNESFERVIIFHYHYSVE